ncbi:MAG: cupin domain-containing protein [Saprospiraceae bacterium]|nr:MAG: cupin domain-containing protein [Saprospiraceae bacterium]
MKTFKVFCATFLVAALFLLGCTSGADKAPADATSAADTTAATPAPAPDANPAIPDSMDVLKKASNVYHLLADSLGLRLYEITFKPGDVAAMHMHPDQAAYVVQGGTLDVTGADGTKTVFDLKPGMGFIFGPEAHSAVNPGKTTVKIAFVEVRRPR